MRNIALLLLLLIAALILSTIVQDDLVIQHFDEVGSQVTPQAILASSAIRIAVDESVVLGAVVVDNSPQE